MLIGDEQRFHPAYSAIERAYIRLFGIPIVGLRIRARILKALIPADSRPTLILDAGSGPGVITFLLARRFPAARILGIDCDPKTVEASQRIAEHANLPNVSFKLGDLLALPNGEKFDLVTCIDILEHVIDDRAAIMNLFRITSPGGTLLLHVPALYRRYPLFSRSLNFNVPTHVRPGYMPEEIVEKVRQSGYVVIAFGYTYGFLETTANNLGYMITRAEKRHKALYAMAFPWLNLLAWLGRGAQPKQLGAGVYLIATKPSNHQSN